MNLQPASSDLFSLNKFNFSQKKSETKLETSELTYASAQNQPSSQVQSYSSPYTKPLILNGKHQECFQNFSLDYIDLFNGDDGYK